LFLVEPGELGTFQGHVVRQALLAEDEAEHRILDIGGVDRAADTDVSLTPAFRGA